MKEKMQKTDRLSLPHMNKNQKSKRINKINSKPRSPTVWFSLCDIILRLLSPRYYLHGIFCCCRYYNSVTESCRTLMIFRSLTVAVFVLLVTLQRYHLFVWTVFSPKLLYEATFSLVASVFVLFCLIVACTLRPTSADKPINSCL